MKSKDYDSEIGKWTKELSNFRDSYDYTSLMFKHPLQFNRVIGILFDKEDNVNKRISYSSFIENEFVRHNLCSYFFDLPLIDNIKIEYASLPPPVMKFIIEKAITKNYDLKVSLFKVLFNEVAKNNPELVSNNNLTLRDLIIEDAKFIKTSLNNALSSEGIPLVNESRGTEGAENNVKNLMDIGGLKGYVIESWFNIIKDVKSLELNDYIAHNDITSLNSVDEINKAINNYKNSFIDKYNNYWQSIVNKFGEVHPYLLQRMIDSDGDIEGLVNELKFPITALTTPEFSDFLEINSLEALTIYPLHDEKKAKEMRDKLINDNFLVPAGLVDDWNSWNQEHKKLMNYEKDENNKFILPKDEPLLSYVTNHFHCIKCLLLDYLTKACFNLKNNINFYDNLLGRSNA